MEPGIFQWYKNWLESARKLMTVKWRWEKHVLREQCAVTYFMYAEVLAAAR